MIVLTSLCGDDGNALKHDGIQLGNMNVLPATTINTPPSAENLKSEGDAESGKASDLQQSMCVLHHCCCRKYLPRPTNPSFFLLSRSFSHHFFLSSFFIPASMWWSTHQPLFPSLFPFCSPSPLCVIFFFFLCPLFVHVCCVWCSSSLISFMADTCLPQC